MDVILGKTQVRTLRHQARDAVHGAYTTLLEVYEALQGQPGLSKDDRLDYLMRARNQMSVLVTNLNKALALIDEAIQVTMDRDDEAHKAVKAGENQVDPVFPSGDSDKDEDLW